MGVMGDEIMLLLFTLVVFVLVLYWLVCLICSVALFGDIFDVIMRSFFSLMSFSIMLLSSWLDSVSNDVIFNIMCGVMTSDI